MHRSARHLHLIVFALAVTFGIIIPQHQAQAGLLGTNVDATLYSPSDGINVSDTVTVATPAIEIQAGDGTNIGGYMFTSLDSSNNPVSEYINFFDTSVTIQIAGAASDGSGMTGYSTGAEYVFSALDSSITGIDSINLSSNISNFSAVAQASGCTADICFDSATQSLSVFLDQITIGPDAAGDLPAPMGLVTVNFSTQAITPPPPSVPEPGTLVLFGIGMAGLGWFRQRQFGCSQRFLELRVRAA